MTGEDLWQEYREKCCPPELGESNEALYWQRMAFFAGVTATIGNIVLRPSCFHELKQWVLDWSDWKATEKN